MYNGRKNTSKCKGYFKMGHGNSTYESKHRIITLRHFSFDMFLPLVGASKSHHPPPLSLFAMHTLSNFLWVMSYAPLRCMYVARFVMKMYTK